MCHRPWTAICAVHRHQLPLQKWKDALSAAKNKAGYSVNALGQRTSKVVDGVETNFFYDEAGQLIGEYGADKTLRQETIWLGDIPVATLKPSAATGQVQLYYTYTDHLNTPRVISDTGNKVVWRWDSDAFGSGAASEDLDGDGVKFTYNLRFPGQYFDKETGLHYNYFRDYDPATGRYVQSDPIGLVGGANPYAYVGGNPVARVDPTGEISGPAVAILIGGGMAAYWFLDFQSCVKDCELTCPVGGEGNTKPRLDCKRMCFLERLPVKSVPGPRTGL